MNTPKPCDTCENLYYNCLLEDDPNDISECKFDLPLGNRKCKKYKERWGQRNERNIEQ